MSKLLEKIEKANQDSSRRIGFSRPVQVQTPPLPLLIGVGRPRKGFPTKGLMQSLDAFLFKINTVEEMDALGGNLAATVWGAWVDTLSPELVTSLKEHGGDFLLFSPEHTPLEVLHDRDLAKLLLVPLAWDQRLSPAFHDLPIDGVVIALEKDVPLTIQQLMAAGSLQRLSGKHILLFLGYAPNQKELEVLRDSGVVCVLLDLAMLDTQAVKEVRQHIDTLPHHRPHGKRSRPSALVPQISVVHRGLDEEDEEDEDF